MYRRLKYGAGVQAEQRFFFHQLIKGVNACVRETEIRKKGLGNKRPLHNVRA